MNAAIDFPVETVSRSNEAECSLIAAVLQIGPDAYDAAASLVRADSFFDPLHSLLWSTCEKMILAGKHVDVVTLMEELRGVEVDWSYVSRLSQLYVNKKATQRHAEIVAGFAKQRALESAAEKITQTVRDESISLEDRVGSSVAALETILDDRQGTDPQPIEKFVLGFIDRIQARADGKEEAGRSTGFPTLDRMMPNGFGDGKLVIIAARPSVGKSSFAQQIALSHAQSGCPAGFLGMEMENSEVVDRTVANLGRVPLTNIITGKLTHDEWDRATEASESMTHLPLYLLDVPGLTLADVASKARALSRKHGLKTLVVDYLQLMQGDPKKERRFQLEEITRGLKRMAKQLRITVVLLSQLNRDVEKRSDPRPQMSDLKECGAIEEDADVILGLWDHKKAEAPDMPSIKGCNVLKNRGGSKGEVALHFEGQYQRWTESTESLKSPEKPSRKGYSNGEF